MWADVYKKEFEQIRKMIAKADNKVIVQHRDVDGTCSAAIIKKFLDFDVIAIRDPRLDEKLMKELVKKKPDAILFLDVAIDRYKDEFKFLQKQLPNCNMVLLDHHPISNDLNKIGILHINPRFQDAESYVPTSRMAFDLMKSFGYKTDDSMWISAIGVISDYGHKTNPDFMEKSNKLYPRLLKGKDIFDTKLGKASKTMYAAIILKGDYGVKYVTDVLLNAKSFSDFESSKEINGWSATVEKEIKLVMDDFEKKKEIVQHIVFYELKTELGLTSIIANIISEKYPDKVIIIYKRAEKETKISTRSQKSIEARSKKPVDLSVVIPKAVEGIGTGGGHPQSSGAIVSDFSLFKKRLVKLVNG